MGRVAERHPSQKEAYYLNGSSSENIDWMLDELRWLEARYEDERDAAAPNTSKDPYLRAARTGRGTKRRPGEEVRKIILEVWAEFRASLAAQERYTIEQATKRLLASNSLPSYDAIAIDEVQDFSIKSVQLLLKFRSTTKARVYLSGDENQKIYQRDFTWKELDSSVRGHTITLRENKRNSYAIRDNTVTFAIGPAGTGKTYLAMAMAVAALKRKEVGRIVLSRPIVEAGENLGFLPGTLFEKVDPYIRPLYDALYSMFDQERANALIENGTIEIAPLAFMRGRTLNDAFIILDEAQNTTPEQMKMALTRLGFGSKIVVTGDISQIDLPRGESGLVQVRSVLEGIDDIAFCDLSGKDVVRHSLVATIVAAYERAAGKAR